MYSIEMLMMVQGYPTNKWNNNNNNENDKAKNLLFFVLLK